MTMNLISPVLRFMLRRPLGPAPMPLCRTPFAAFAPRKVGRFPAANPEVHEVRRWHPGILPSAGKAGWDGSADALIIRRGFDRPGGHVAKSLGEVDLDNLIVVRQALCRRGLGLDLSAGAAPGAPAAPSASAAAAALPPPPPVITTSFIRLVYRAHRHSHEGPTLLPAQSVRSLRSPPSPCGAVLTHSAEDEPFAIGGPLPMRLIDFGLAIPAIRAGQKCERKTRDGSGTIFSRMASAAHLRKHGGRGKQHDDGETSGGLDSGVHVLFLLLRLGFCGLSLRKVISLSTTVRPMSKWLGSRPTSRRIIPARIPAPTPPPPPPPDSRLPVRKQIDVLEFRCMDRGTEQPSSRTGTTRFHPAVRARAIQT